jgi:hypothetical protein
MTKELWEEIKRKIGRIIVGTIPVVASVYIYNRYGIEVFRNAYFFILVTVFFFDYVRVELKLPFPFLYDQFSFRSSERTWLHGTTLGSIGCVLAIAFLILI